jgi:hypothetical protein
MPQDSITINYLGRVASGFIKSRAFFSSKKNRNDLN